MRAIALSIVASLLVAGSAAAQDEGFRYTRNPESLSDAELDRRLQFLQETLDDGQTYARVWQYGWTSLYAGGVPWGIYHAVDTDTESTRVANIVTASKATLGVTRMLLQPHPGRKGSNPMAEIQGEDRASKLKRLQAGEEQLWEVSERARTRWRWDRHAGNVALNLIGGAVIMGFGHNKAALENAGLGILVGQAMIFSEPWRGETDRDAYLRRFEGKQAAVSFGIAPTTSGATLFVQW